MSKKSISCTDSHEKKREEGGGYLIQPGGPNLDIRCEILTFFDFFGDFQKHDPDRCKKTHFFDQNLGTLQTEMLGFFSISADSIIPHFVKKSEKRVGQT